MLTFPVIFQRMEAVGRRISEIVDQFGAVEHSEANERAILNVRRQFSAANTIPDFLGFGIGERADHLNSSIRRHSLSSGRRACQKRQPLTFVPEIALAASDGLFLTIPSWPTH